MSGFSRLLGESALREKSLDEVGRRAVRTQSRMAPRGMETRAPSSWGLSGGRRGGVIPGGLWGRPRHGAPPLALPASSSLIRVREAQSRSRGRAEGESPGSPRARGWPRC